MPQIDYNALGDIVDTTWGKPSTPVQASSSVKFTFMHSDRLVCTYQAIVNFTTERNMFDQQRKHLDEAQAVIEAAISGVKKAYKSRVGSALRLKEESSPIDSFNVVDMSSQRPRRTAILSRRVTYEIGA